MDTRGAHDLGDFSKLTQEQKEALAAQARDAGTRPAATAFLVVLTPGGGAVAHPDPSYLERYEAAPATWDQIAAACHQICDDIVANKAAQITVAGIAAQAKAAMEQAESQRMWQQAQQNGHRG